MEYNNKYISFWFKKWFTLTFDICGYFDNRPRININLFFFYLVIKLPFENNWTDECDPPSWWIRISGEALVILLWGKWNMNWWNRSLYFNFPFVTKKFILRSILLKDWSWEHELNRGSKNFWDDNIWKGKRMEWEYLFTDKFDWSKIPTSLYIEEMEWRPKWLTWTPLFKKVRRYIEVEFSEEVWWRKWSWKWWTIGCSYNLIEWENPIDCIKRMENDRNF